MRTQIHQYDTGDVTSADSDERKRAPGTMREVWTFFAYSATGDRAISIRLSYWARQRKAKNGRWVNVDTWDSHSGNRWGKHRDNPPKPNDNVKAAAVRTLAGAFEFVGLGDD